MEIQPDNLIQEIEDYLKTRQLISEEELEACLNEAIWCSWSPRAQI